jgi:methylenetetrahydrofolate dehydrogenase (NADP+) / methenyltetrahydrofolate cyclohydrolase
LPAELLDGKRIAQEMRAEVAERVSKLVAAGVKPGLSVLLVGDDAASAVYVAAKGKACEEVGMRSETIRFPGTATQQELLARVELLNTDPRVHGMLVQFPLPKQIDSSAVILAIDPRKDVDCFHPVNVGRMLIGDRGGFLPCTPAGVQEMLKRAGVKTSGKRCVIVGRSNIVGKPMAALMMQPGEGANCTVTVCHSGTKDLGDETRRADILIAATGRAGLITKEMVKPGAVVVDVGMNRIPDASAKSGTRLVGDVDFEGVKQVAALITPVPGGVGPMTIAMLLMNTVAAAERTVVRKEH